MANQTIENQLQDLIAEIEAAFDGVAREDGTTLHEALAMDGRESDQEQLAARRLDTEHRWQDVPAESILKSNSFPSFLDAKGFRYYLPAFLVLGLKNWETTESAILDACESRLLRESPKSLRQSEPASIAATHAFTMAQCKAIAHFLRFQVEDDDELTTQERPTLEAVAKWESFVGERSKS